MPSWLHKKVTLILIVTFIVASYASENDARFERLLNNHDHSDNYDHDHDDNESNNNRHSDDDVITHHSSIHISNFKPSHSNQYVCTAKRLDDNKTLYVRGFEPSDANGAAHHILLYGCQYPGLPSEPVWDCGEMSRKDKEGGGDSQHMKYGPICGQKGSQAILFAEAMQAGSYKLPDNVAFKIGTDTPYNYLVIQIHYKDADMFINNSSLSDNSGIKFSYQTQPTQLLAGVLLLGSAGVIRPNSVSESPIESLDIVCYPDELVRQQAVVPFAYRTHAHKYGLLNTGFRVTDYSLGASWDLIGRMSPQMEQTFYPVENDMLIEPDDVLVARCVYTNPTEEVVQIGPTADDEMCNFYIMYYTVDGSEISGDRMCFGDGTDSWRQQLYPLSVPDWAQDISLNMSPEEQKTVFEQMQAKMGYK